MAIAVLMVAALCVSATATFNLDRMYVNANVLEDAYDVKNDDPIHIERGDRLYILGWAANPDGVLTEVVYTIDGGEEQPCSDCYRDRPDVASVGIAVADNGAHAGIGYNEDMMELLGIDALSDGTYELTLIAKYADGLREEQYYTLEVGTGISLMGNVDLLKTARGYENYGYLNEILMLPGDQLFALGWAFKSGAGPLEKIVYTINGEVFECSDVYRDRPDVAAAFGESVPEGGANAGFGTDEQPIELLGVSELAEGAYELTLRGVFKDGSEGDFKTYTLYVGEKKRMLETVEEGMLNIIVDGGTNYVEAFRGDTVDVKVELVNNTGICSVRLDMSWSDYLTLVDVKYDIYDENKHSQMINDLDEEYFWEGVEWRDMNDFVFNWVDANGKVEGDTTFLTLTFEVDEYAPINEFLWINAEADGSDIFADLDDYLDYRVISGGIDVVPDRGDVDCDGLISNRDVVMLFRYVNGDSFRLIKKAADVTGDTEINNKDVVELFRMSSALDR